MPFASCCIQIPSWRSLTLHRPTLFTDIHNDRARFCVAVSGGGQRAIGALMGAALLMASPTHAADPALVEAAQREGKVTWYTTLIVNQAIRPLQQAFEQKYPGVRLEYSRADDSPTALKIITEARAGGVQADIFDGLYNMIAL